MLKGEGPSSSQEQIEKDEQKGEEESRDPSPAWPAVQEYWLWVPYLSRLKVDNEDAHYKKCMSIFKQLHINIPIIEALS